MSDTVVLATTTASGDILSTYNVPASRSLKQVIWTVVAGSTAGSLLNARCWLSYLPTGAACETDQAVGNISSCALFGTPITSVVIESAVYYCHMLATPLQVRAGEKIYLHIRGTVNVMNCIVMLEF